VNIFQSLTNNSAFQGAVKEVFASTYTPSQEPETLDSEPERLDHNQDLRPWSEVPLIEMLPIKYRPAAQKILAEDPGASIILRDCKLGVSDCWEAMDRLGIRHEF
jgi:hypothetical protein